MNGDCASRVQESPRIPNQHQHPTILGALQQAAWRYIQETDRWPKLGRDRKKIGSKRTDAGRDQDQSEDDFGHEDKRKKALRTTTPEQQDHLQLNYLWDTNWIQILTKRWISHTSLTENCSNQWSPTWTGWRNRISENTKWHWKLTAQLFMLPHDRVTDNCERVTKNCTKKHFTVETLLKP